LRKPIIEKRASGVAQYVGPEFKSQYCKKKKRRRRRRRTRKENSAPGHMTSSQDNVHYDC
jgi:hypothetical protein